MSIPPVSGSPEIDVAYVAALARLELTADEKERFQQQLGGILSFIETLSELDVDGVEPTAHPAPVHDCFRADEAVAGLSRDAFLRNAPDSALDQIRVPKVVDS
jgi:aspartyl-tRNA(Asn)/glutamyl-tRNA(Gln) amidotransferase subunit C